MVTKSQIHSAHHSTTDPEGYSEAMPIMDAYVELECKKRTQLPLPFRRFNRILVLTSIAVVLSLAILPWQQFIQGQGKVIAFNPLERSVAIEAPLPGRVHEVFVVEGQQVTKGQQIIQITDNDPSLVENLNTQLEDMRQQRQAAVNKLERMQNRVKQVELAFHQAMDIARRKLEAAQASQKAADLNFERTQSLFQDPRGLVSQREYELATLQRDSKAAETLQAEAQILKTELDQYAAIENARASADSAQSDLNKLDKEITDLRIKINQTGTLNVIAPRDGIVFRLQATEGTYLKAGSPLCTIVPESDDLVVEMWVDGNDMPLIREREVTPDGSVLEMGSPVRLQFEGWPAIQFAGWPSVAIGTFGGEVIFVDAMDNGNGQFRVLVAPNPDKITDAKGNTDEISWPAAPVMRQRVAAQGWVLLERVPLWFEVWRQLNGFPPSVRENNKFKVKAEVKAK